MTNLERIKAMDANALANFINLTHPNCNEFCKDASPGCSFNCKHNNGKDVIQKWLGKDVGFNGEI